MKYITMLLKYNDCNNRIMGGGNMCEIFYYHSEEHPHGWGLDNMQSDEFVIAIDNVKFKVDFMLQNSTDHFHQ